MNVLQMQLILWFLFNFKNVLNLNENENNNNFVVCFYKIALRCIESGNSNGSGYWLLGP